jgi:hypothetical protein
MAAETVIVKEVGPGKPWQHGITYYDVLFQRNGSSFGANWGKKGEAPVLGESVVGEFSQKDDGSWKFKKGSAEPAFDATSSPLPTQFSGETPDNRQASIVRQVALKILAPSINEAGGLTASLKAKAEEIERFVMAASQTPQQPSTAVPAHSEEKDLHELLEAAGLHYEAARVVTAYVDDQFSPEQRDTAIGRLNDPNQAQGALAKLKELAETHNGEPLPADVSDPADDPIPF